MTQSKFEKGMLEIEVKLQKKLEAAEKAVVNVAKLPLDADEHTPEQERVRTLKEALKIVQDKIKELRGQGEKRYLFEKIRK